MKENKFVIVFLVSLALVSQSFLFAVAYTDATFQGTNTPLPDYFAPSVFSQTFDNNLTVIADNLVWSVQVSYDSIKQPLMAVLDTPTSAVLGVHIINPEYYQGSLADASSASSSPYGQ